jgi:dihydroorotate dehydrogenase electron transfer subunit
VHGIDTTGSVPHLKFLYQVVGRGTTILSRLNPGEELDLLGPLGNGFSLIPDMEEAILIAGGIGVAPFLELSRMIRRKFSDARLLTFIGGKTATDIFTVEDISQLGVEVRIVTEDGGMGAKGMVTEALDQYLSVPSEKKRQIFACGPWGMIQRITQLSSIHGIHCQLSLDRAMACGVGVCRGCVVSVKDPDAPGGFRYQTVCQDGPVFEAKTLFFP